MNVLHSLEYLAHVVPDLTERDGVVLSDCLLNHLLKASLTVLQDHLLTDQIVFTLNVNDVQ
jgi:hypothetical protein